MPINRVQFGIYSSAGTYTCGGKFGSLDFEEIDAQTYASWGVDYLSELISFSFASHTVLSTCNLVIETE